MRTRVHVAVAACMAVLTVVLIAVRISANRTDRAIGPIASTTRSVEATTAEAPELSTRTPIAPRCRIDGTVVDARGVPIDPREGSIELRGPGDSITLSTWSSDGSFAFEGLAPGHWTVRVLGPKWDEDVVRVELAAPEGTDRADVVLRRVRTVSVRIVDSEGRPLAASLAANGLEPAHAGRVEIDEEGRSTVTRTARTFLEPVPGSIQLVEGSSPRLRLLVGDALLDEVRPEANCAEVVLTAHIERIRAHAGWVTFQLPEPGPLRTLVEFTTDRGENREVQFARDERSARIGVEPGTMVMRITPEGYVEIRRRLRIAPGETVALGTLTLEPECILRGVVRTRDGQPIGGPVVVRQVGKDEGIDAASGQATSDTNGRFLVRGLRRGSWLVYCEWGGPTSWVELPHTTELELVGEFPAPDRARQGSR